MINLTREEAQQVLDALAATDDFLFNYHDCEPNNEREMDSYSEIRGNNNEAIETLRARISAPKPEPVAYLVYDRGASSQHLAFDDELGDMDGCDIEPLYIAPPQREWVGMTDEEIKKEQHRIDWTAEHTYANFARAIEAKLREKNNE